MKKKKLAAKIIFTLLMAIIGVAMLLPFAWMLSTSFKPSNQAFNFPIDWIPNNFTVENYVKVWGRDIPFYQYYFNSLKVTLLSVFGELLTCGVAGYAFAKIHFKGSRVVFLIYLSTLAFPNQMMLIPRFVLFKALGLYNTHWALILPGMFSAFGTFLLKQFFESIPESLSESAKLDGAGHFTVFSQVVVPLSKPAFSSLIIFQFVTHWNDYEGPLVYLRQKALATIPLALNFFKDDMGSDYGAIMAASVCGLIPIFIVFLLFQKQFVAGIATSGMKE